MSGYLPGILNRGVPLFGPTSLPGETHMLTVDAAGSVAHAPIPEADLDDAVILSPETSLRNVITPSAIDVVPVTIEGLPGQSAPLQQWQGSGLGRVAIRDAGMIDVEGDGTTRWLGVCYESGTVPQDPTLAVLKPRAFSVQGAEAAYVIGIDTTRNIQFVMGTSTAGIGFCGTLSNHEFEIRTSNQPRVRIDTNGRTGFGTTNPLASVDARTSATSTVGILSRGTNEAHTLIVAQIGTVDRLRVLGNGNVTLHLAGIPDGDPNVAGQLYRDGTDLRISTG